MGCASVLRQFVEARDSQQTAQQIFQDQGDGQAGDHNGQHLQESGQEPADALDNFVHGSRQLSNKVSPHSKPHFPPSHNLSRYGFSLSNVMHSASMLLSNSSEDASWFSLKKVNARPRNNGTRACTM